MVSIVKAKEDDSHLLSEMAKITLLESHGNSATAEDMNHYVTKNYSEDVLKKELQDPGNIYHILYYNNKAAGYSKIILNSPYEKGSVKNMAKLERLYLLKEFYNLHLGVKLFEFNVNLIKESKQSGVWLTVWTENQRAINFYKKNGFEIIGSCDFKISETHSNPNHQMLLSFK